MKSEPDLFAKKQKVEVPPVKQATEGEVVGGFEKELAACKTQQQIEAVMKKYGKA